MRTRNQEIEWGKTRIETGLGEPRRETLSAGATDVRAETSDVHRTRIEPEARPGEQTQTRANPAREGKAKPVATRDRLGARRIQTEKSDRSFCARVEQGA
jgi:hypothetical protein